MIKAVIFDVDGVLLDSFEANLNFYQDLMIFSGHQPPNRETFKKMFHMTMKDVLGNLVGSDEVDQIWNLGKSRAVPYPDELIASPENLEPVIKALAESYQLAIVTSRIAGSVFSVPQLSNYQRLFKVVIYYEDTVLHKPDPSPLLEACNRLHIKPTEAVYIGDALTDIQAARSANMNVISFSKEELGADESTVDFEELPTLIHNLGR